MRKTSPRARLAGLAAATLLSLLPLAQSASAAAIPADAAGDPKVLWRMVMQEYYGPYNATLKCWTARMGEDRICMRPHKLDRVTIKGTEHLFLAIGGPKLDENGEFRSAHVDSASLGLLVFRVEGDTLKLVAKNDLNTPVGSFGNVPGEESFALREIGPNGTYGWVIQDGWMGQGHVITYSNIFAPVGDTVVSIGSIPSHYDNSGNCEGGKVMGSETPCTDYSGELIFDSADTSGRFFPVILKVTGTREGTTLNQAATTKFDAGKLTYQPLQGLPEEFANGI